MRRRQRHVAVCTSFVWQPKFNYTADTSFVPSVLYMLEFVSGSSLLGMWIKGHKSKVCACMISSALVHFRVAFLGHWPH